MDIDQIVHSNLFNKDKQEELFKFLHACIDEICNANGPIFSQFTNIDWTKEEFHNVHNYVLSLLYNTNCLYINKDNIPLEFHELPDHVLQTILVCLKVRRSHLTDALLIKYSSTYIPTIIDFDWRLKYVMGSSKMASIREALLQLDFILKEKNKADILALEFNKDELESFINTIEGIIS